MFLHDIAFFSSEGAGKIEKDRTILKKQKKTLVTACMSQVHIWKRKFLIVLLHGLGSNPQQVIRYKGIVEQAESRGYIVVAPFGYNERGWYGSRGKAKKEP